MDWAQILVIILGIFLAIFLVIGIALGVMIIRLTRQIRTVAAIAERAAAHAERAMKGASIAAVPSMIIGKVLNQFRRGHHGSK